MANRSKSFLRYALRLVQRENLHRIGGTLVLFAILSSVALWYLEDAVQPDVGLAGWLWWSLVTLTTVGYGDITPTTPYGRMIGVVLMFFGIGVLSTLTATIASFFVERKLKRDRGMGSYDFEKHIILCHWNHRTEEVLRELRLDRRTAESPVVLIAELEAKPVDDDDLHFIKGPINDATLRRAGIETAATAVILGDDQLEETGRDAQVVIATLTVESLNPDVYTIVELALAENIQHCRRAHADEIIVGAEFASRLMSTSAVDHGLSRVVSELLTQGSGHDIEKHPVPDELVGSSFFDAMCSEKKANRGIPVAVQRGEAVETNPAADFRLVAGDHLISIVNKVSE